MGDASVEGTRQEPGRIDECVAMNRPQRVTPLSPDPDIRRSFSVRLVSAGFETDKIEERSELVLLPELDHCKRSDSLSLDQSGRRAHGAEGQVSFPRAAISSTGNIFKEISSFKSRIGAFSA